MGGWNGMNYDRFIEDHKEALDRFVAEYQKHIHKEKDQLQFMDREYWVEPDQIEHINQNVVRIRESMIENRNKSTMELDELYGIKFKELGDELSIPIEGELVIEDIEEAEKILTLFAEKAGEWMNGYIKYFGFIDALDGVHQYQGLLSFVHSNSQYKAIHIGAFRKMVILRPAEDILLIVIENDPSSPFLSMEETGRANSIFDEGKAQMVYSSFFGVKYHIRLFLKEGDHLLLTPAYLARRGYSPSLLEECLLYAEG
jgi:hypothetical protein